MAVAPGIIYLDHTPCCLSDPSDIARSIRSHMMFISDQYLFNTRSKSINRICVCRCGQHCHWHAQCLSFVYTVKPHTFDHIGTGMELEWEWEREWNGNEK